MAKTSIVTGENVILEQEGASLLQRGLSWIIDLTVISFAQVVVVPILIAAESITHNSNITIALFILLETAVSTYPLLMEIFNHGQTLGKRLCGIQVIRLDGTEPSLSDYMTRWILLLVDLFFFLIGMVFIIFTKNSQRLGDLAAGTTVVKKHQYGDLFYDLQEFDYARKNYKPQFAEAAHLTPGQAELIQRSFWINNWSLKMQTQLKLTQKVCEVLNIEKGDMTEQKFLRSVFSDYHYFQSESIV